MSLVIILVLALTALILGLLRRPMLRQLLLLAVSALAVSAFFIGQDVTWPHMIGCALSIGSVALIGGPKPG